MKMKYQVFLIFPPSSQKGSFFVSLSPTARQQHDDVCVLLPFFPLFNSDLIFRTLFFGRNFQPAQATVEQQIN